MTEHQSKSSLLSSIKRFSRRYGLRRFDISRNLDILFAKRVLSRQQLYYKLQTALETNRSFSIAKIGHNEIRTVFYSKYFHNISKCIPDLCTGAGVFPPDKEIASRWVDSYLADCNSIDILSPTHFDYIACILYSTIWQSKGITLNRFMAPAGSNPFWFDEPQEFCFTKLLLGKRILVINPIASFLVSRANKEIFDKCWNQHLQWWNPATVSALDIPNGVDRNVQKSYSNYFELSNKIRSQAREYTGEFDIALIGAGAYAAGIAAEIKKMNKVALVLGGYIHIMFGVYGNRWYNNATWRQKVFNEHWQRPPEILRPVNFLDQEDGAYW